MKIISLVFRVLFPPIRRFLLSPCLRAQSGDAASVSYGDEEFDDFEAESEGEE